MNQKEVEMSELVLAVQTVREKLEDLEGEKYELEELLEGFLMKIQYLESKNEA